MDLQTALSLLDELIAAARRDPCDPDTAKTYERAYWRVVDALRESGPKSPTLMCSWCFEPIGNEPHRTSPSGKVVHRGCLDPERLDQMIPIGLLPRSIP